MTRTADKVNIHTVKSLGRKQSLTPEGFLLVQDVPVCRPGMMLYGEGETPITVGRDGVARITRDEKEVFDPVSMRTFIGKALTIGHPDEDVNPENWSQLSRGIVLDARRGEGINSDFVVMDFLVTHKATIDAIRKNRIEVSAGYDAEYIPTGYAQGRQEKIVGNHVALVPRGRCGPRCSIGDHATVQQEQVMSKGSILTLIGRALGVTTDEERAAVLSDAAALEDGDGAHHVTVNLSAPLPATTHDCGGPMNTNDADMPEWFKAYQRTVDERMNAMQEALTGLQPALQVTAPTGDAANAEAEAVAQRTRDAEAEAVALGVLAEEFPAEMRSLVLIGKARDSAFMEDSFQETVALGEIIAPGVKFPTFDRALDPKATLDQLTGFRRTVLDRANQHLNTQTLIANIMPPNKEFSTAEMTPVEVRSLFRAVGAAKKAINMHGNARDKIAQPIAAERKAGPMSPAEINARNREYWNKNGGVAA